MTRDGINKILELSEILLGRFRVMGNFEGNEGKIKCLNVCLEE